MDLSQLTVTQVLILLIAVAFIDFVSGLYSAFRPPNTFSWDVVANVLETHVLKRIIPIMLPVYVALSSPPGQNHDALWASALVAIGLYVTETINSIVGNVTTPQTAPPSP